MKGATKGLLGLLNADALYPNFLSIHCIIHREHLVAKYWQFKTFIQEIENDELPDDVSWFCLVRWLSVSNVLTKIFNLMEPIKQFLNENAIFFPELEDTQWLVDMAYFPDIFQDLKSLN